MVTFGGRTVCKLHTRVKAYKSIHNNSGVNIVSSSASCLLKDTCFSNAWIQDKKKPFTYTLFQTLSCFSSIISLPWGVFFLQTVKRQFSRTFIQMASINVDTHLQVWERRCQIIHLAGDHWHTNVKLSTIFLSDCCMTTICIKCICCFSFI